VLEDDSKPPASVRWGRGLHGLGFCFFGFQRRNALARARGPLALGIGLGWRVGASAASVTAAVGAPPCFNLAFGSPGASASDRGSVSEFSRGWGQTQEESHAFPNFSLDDSHLIRDSALFGRSIQSAGS